MAIEGGRMKALTICLAALLAALAASVHVADAAPKPKPPSRKPPRPSPPRPRPPRPSPPRPRPPPPKPGASFATAIDLGSAANVQRDATSVGFQDIALSGCADKDFYGGKSFGDGADVIFKYKAPFTGFVKVAACSNAFQATLTLIGNSVDADGSPIRNGTLACGYYDSCDPNNPDLFDPTTQTVIALNQGQVIYIHVTGQAATDKGPFKLSVAMIRPGGEQAAAINLGSPASIAKIGSSVGLPDTYTSNCTEGSDGADVWYSYTVKQTGVMRVSVCPRAAGFTPSVVLRTDAVTGTGNGDVQLDGCGSCNTPVTVPVKAGDFYYFIVSGGAANAAGPFTLKVLNTPLPLTGTSYANAINLGNSASAERNLTSFYYPDIALSGCADPDFFNNHTYGDGGDVFHKYTMPYDGFLGVFACSNTFQVTMTIIGNGTDADGNPITNGTIACGYYDSCDPNNPDVSDPTTQTVIQASQGDNFIIQITGQAATDYGPYRLAVNAYKPGSNSAAAINLGSPASLTVNGSVTDLPDSYKSNCTFDGTGSDIWYTYTANVTGILRVKVCSDSDFVPSLAIRTDSLTGTGNGEIEVPQCGSCDTPIVLNVKANDFFYFIVSGDTPDDFGDFTLSVTNVVPAVNGTTFATAIDLGSAPAVLTNSTTFDHPDVALSGCADPDFFNNQTFGDGGDAFFKYTVPYDGFLRVFACSNDFQATMTVIGNGNDTDGNPVTNGTLACGYYDSCDPNNPDLFDPTTQTVIDVDKGQVVYLQVTGQSGASYGAFRLSVETLLPGSGDAAAIFVGNATNLTVSGSTAGLPDTYNANCTAGSNVPDVWYSYDVPKNGTLKVEACSSALNATVSLASDALNGVGNGIAPVKSCGLCGKPLSVNVTSDNFYYIIVSAGAGNVTSGPFNLTISTT